jgi:hypothetical protein
VSDLVFSAWALLYLSLAVLLIRAANRKLDRIVAMWQFLTKK